MVIYIVWTGHCLWNCLCCQHITVTKGLRVPDKYWKAKYMPIYSHQVIEFQRKQIREYSIALVRLSLDVSSYVHQRIFINLSDISGLSGRRKNEIIDFQPSMTPSTVHLSNFFHSILVSLTYKVFTIQGTRLKFNVLFPFHQGCMIVFV